MYRNRLFKLMVVGSMLAVGACSSAPEPSQLAPWSLKELVEPIQKSVVTVVNYDVNGEVSSIGSGFFISESGELLTNFHVMDGAYNAEIKTHDGSQYPIETVLARSQLIDLIKVRVDIPDNQVTPVVLSREATAVADSIFVVGSPHGIGTNRLRGNHLCRSRDADRG
jgi:serine protease Do